MIATTLAPGVIRRSTVEKSATELSHLRVVLLTVTWHS